MAFSLREDFYNVSTRHGLLDNTITVKVGDVIAPLSTTDNVYSNATSLVAGSGVYVLGVVTGFSKKNGEVVSTGQDPVNTPNQYTTASNNTTVGLVYATYIPIYSHMIWSATLSAAAGTTAHTDADFASFPLSDCRTLDEASGVVILNAQAPNKQFISFGVDLTDDPSSLTVFGKFQKALMFKP